MSTPCIILKKRFPFSNVRIEISPGNEWKATSAYDKEVAKVWRERQVIAARKGLTLWDGTYYRVVNADDIKKNKELFLRLGTVAYRYIATVSTLKESFTANSFESLFHLSTAAVVRTSDNYYLFGERSWNGEVDLIGGGVQKDQVEITAGADLEKNLLKEMEEEAGIQRPDIRSMQGMDILQSTTSNVLIIADVQLALSRRDVTNAFKERGEDEMVRPVFVAADELRAYLGKMTSYRPLIVELLKD